MHSDELCREMSVGIFCRCLYSSQLQTSSLIASGLNASTLSLICRNITTLLMLHLEGRAALAGLEDTLLHSTPGMDAGVLHSTGMDAGVLHSQRYKPDLTKSGYPSHPVLVALLHRRGKKC